MRRRAGYSCGTGASPVALKLLMGEAPMPRLLHFPFEDSAGEIGLKLRDQAEGFGFDGGEVGAVEGVYGGGVAGGAFDFFPFVANFVEEFPGGRDAALAGAGVVKPIDFRG